MKIKTHTHLILSTLDFSQVHLQIKNIVKSDRQIENGLRWTDRTQKKGRLKRKMNRFKTDRLEQKIDRHKDRQTDGQTDKHDQSPKSLTKCLHDMERKMSN